MLGLDLRGVPTAGCGLRFPCLVRVRPHRGRSPRRPEREMRPHDDSVRPAPPTAAPYRRPAGGRCAAGRLRPDPALRHRHHCPARRVPGGRRPGRCRPDRLAGRVQRPGRHRPRLLEVAPRHRRPRLGQQRAAVLHQQHPQRRPRRQREHGDHGPAGERSATTATTARASTPPPGCSPPAPSPGRTAGSRHASSCPRDAGHVAGVLDARRRRRPSRWPNSGEIDIMENIGREPSNRARHPARPRLLRRRTAIGSRYTLPNGQQFADAFHTFTVDWEPNVDHLVRRRHPVLAARRRPT